ncbi:methyltransferase family protein [Terracoccus luteus]|uniref:Methyltransferase family protein n=1 Tax=Terracoccus luteus TaxID=53356 RepID=A0A495Y293_9MICO|nr:methyltransferase domain-containing protein [Terracoccus luteus]RKT79525.1 methyltransferase family protein [Terracoccus luteus]
MTTVETEHAIRARRAALVLDSDRAVSDPGTRAAWRDLLLQHLPEPPADVIDLGDGTGALALLLREEGHQVIGLVGSSGSTRERDGGTTLDPPAEQWTMDATADPETELSTHLGRFDVVMGQHVLSGLPDPDASVRLWLRLLRPGGRLVLVEGLCADGFGVAAEECQRLLLQHRNHLDVTNLPEHLYWGWPVTDERYLVVSAR